MRRRTRRRMRESLMTILVIAGIPAAITAPSWVTPRWIGIALAVIGWAVYAYLALGQMILFWDMIRRPVAKRPWILGGPPILRLPGTRTRQVVIHSWPKQSRAGRCRDVETLIQRSHLTVEAGHRNSTVQAGYCSTASQKRRRQPWRPHLHVRPVWISCSKKPRRGP